MNMTTFMPFKLWRAGSAACARAPGASSTAGGTAAALRSSSRRVTPRDPGGSLIRLLGPCPRYAPSPLYEQSGTLSEPLPRVNSYTRAAANRPISARRIRGSRGQRLRWLLGVEHAAETDVRRGGVDGL